MRHVNNDFNTDTNISVYSESAINEKERSVEQIQRIPAFLARSCRTDQTVVQL